ncbi:MAG: hypothetical protein RLZZ596_1462 [Pseudomonadota bacterium]|jgi:iron(III) transport system ATP-binding protein
MYLEIQNLSVRYEGQDTPAVASVSLGLMPGDIGVLLGPSGCGKTTLLRAIAGLEGIAAGQIRLAGRVVATTTESLPAQQRRVGMVFQDYALFPHLTVAQNVAYGLQALPAAQRAQRMAQVLELVDLSSAAQAYPHALSGGQQQRVALARALAPQPDLLLLDEPFSNLDVELRQRLADDLRQILKRAHTTALMVTHDQHEAFAMADMVGVMQGGQLHQWDTPYATYHRPGSRFVAEFVGRGVWVPAVLTTNAGQLRVQTPVGALSDPQECPLPDAYPAGQCEVLVRADDVVYDPASSVRARIVRKDFQGADFLYTLELEAGLQVLAWVPSHHNHELGEHIGIRLEMDHVVTFATP